MHILTLNSGSSSIKFSLIDPDGETTALDGIVENINGSNPCIRYNQTTRSLPKNDYQVAMEAILAALGSPDIQGVGHRVVHGGEKFKESVVIDDTVLQSITDCIPLAPLHNPANIFGIKTAQHLFPVPQVAVFDTAFHQTMPKEAYLYALPYELYERLHIRRYGFHGISHQYVTEKLGKENVISCHLGNGCSVTAVKNGKSVDTTMGLTPLEGVVMGTRSGDIDPGIIGFLSKTMDVEAILDMLNKESGLLGISGESMDMRTLEASKNERAHLAIEIFCYRLAKSIMALSVPLGKVDAVILTGGIGENSKRVQKRIKKLVPQYEFVIIPTDEALMIARETKRLL